MNLMGKIFTFMIFLMSTVFLIVSIMVGASDRNWKQKAADEKTRASSATNSIDSLKNDTAQLVKTLEFEKASRARQLQNLQSLNLKTKDELDETSKKYFAEQDLARGYLRELEEAQRRLVDQDSEIKNLKENNKQLVNDISTQFAENRNIEKVLFEQTSKLEELKQKEADLAAQLALSDKVLKANGLTGQSLTASIAPKIEAVVTAVGRDGDKFAIMAGMDDGLRKGHQMDILRGGRFVGVGVIVAAENNRSVLSTVKGTMNDSVREGDNVSTKL